MKKNVLLTGLFSFFVVLLITSCVSLSASEPAAIQPDQAVMELLNNARINAQEARKMAFDFECHEYFPSDWAAIEARYAAANALPAKTYAQAQYAIAAFNAAASLYNELFRRTIPLYAQAWEDEIIFAREELLASGLRGRFPEYLRRADEMAVYALRRYQAGDFHGARDTAAKALHRYNVLIFAAGVYLARERVVAGGFAVHDRENFARAESAALAALDEMEAQNYGLARNFGEEALFFYRLVYQAAMEVTGKY